MAKLTETELQTALASLPGWAITNGMLVKTFELPTFPDAIALVTGAAELAEEQGHHPDMDIRYNKVTVALVTHDQGGITEKDVQLAQGIEAQSHFPERAVEEAE